MKPVQPIDGKPSRRIHSIGGVGRTDEALLRLGITSQQLAEAPQITPLLKQADGGLKQVMDAMRLAPDETISAYLRKHDSIPIGDRERLSVEAIALAAGLDITRLLASILIALQSQAVSTTKMIAMTAHPKITAARVRYGVLPLGERDRTALDTAMGFLPNPKGPTFIGKAIFGSGKNVIESQRSGDDDTEEGELIGSDDVDLDRLFPPANAMQDRLTPYASACHRRKSSRAGPVPPSLPPFLRAVVQPATACRSTSNAFILKPFSRRPGGRGG